MVCDICLSTCVIFCINFCGHATCGNCAIKIRWQFNYFAGSKPAKLKKTRCCFCRASWRKLQIGRPGATLLKFNRKNPYDKELKVFYTDKADLKFFHERLQIRCHVCVNRKFQSIEQLCEHLGKKHQKYVCLICLDNLKMQLQEHTFYGSKQSLDKHKKNHPICRVCNTRKFSEQALEEHLKNDHYQCPSCPRFYAHKLSDARKHYRSKHYLCEIGNCKKTVMFFLNREEFIAHQLAHHHLKADHEKHKKRKAKRFGRTSGMQERIIVQKKVAETISAYLRDERQLYHIQLISANPPPQLLFKSFRVCWDSCCDFKIWERVWLQYCSLEQDFERAQAMYECYRSWCYDPNAQESIKRWTPLLNDFENPLKSNSNDFPSLGDKKKQQPRRQQGAWVRRNVSAVKSKQGFGGPATSKKTQLQGAWAKTKKRTKKKSNAKQS